MRAIKISRKLHKWFALFLGIQLFLWSLSGFYMVVVNIDIIHGDMLVKNDRVNLVDESNPHWQTSFNQLVERYPKANRLSLKNVAGRPAFLVEGSRTILIDARSNKQLSPLDEKSAVAIAKYHYANTGSVKRVELLESNPPSEIQFRPLPLWRVDFDDAWSTSFYIHPDSGQFTTRRHTLWRVFDFLWMLHIMDYETRDEINNTILRIVSVLGVILGFGGAWLLFYSFKDSFRNSTKNNSRKNRTEGTSL